MVFGIFSWLLDVFHVFFMMFSGLDDGLRCIYRGSKPKAEAGVACYRMLQIARRACKFVYLEGL